MNRKRKAEDQALCPYGSSCYRKNPEHRKKFHSDPAIYKKKTIESTGKKVITTKEQVKRASLKDSSKTLGQSLKSNEKDKITAVDSDTSTDDISKTLPRTNIKSKKGNSETVEDVLKSMPPDFFDFWDFCSSVNKSKPAEAFADIGLHLVGVYDLLIKKMPKDKIVNINTHWRYYYDPPEFQTVIRTDDKDLYHIGYLRDDPAKFPNILAAISSDSPKTGPKCAVKGDNIFAAVEGELTKRLKDLDAEITEKISKVESKLKLFAKKKGYNLLINTPKVKARQKSVVSSTFHGLGIVVPFKNDIGYRPLPDSNQKLKSILKNITDAKSKEERLSREELLDEIITNVHFANDEGDFGMGLELGIDLFCFGHSQFHPQCLNLLTIAYGLLNRHKYIEVLTAHLANRRKGGDLSDL